MSDSHSSKNLPPTNSSKSRAEEIAIALADYLKQDPMNNLPKFHKLYWTIAGAICYDAIILGNYSLVYSSPEVYLIKVYGWSRFMIQKWAVSFQWVLQNCPEILPGGVDFERARWERLPEEKQIFTLAKREAEIPREDYEREKELFIGNWRD